MYFSEPDKPTPDTEERQLALGICSSHLSRAPLDKIDEMGRPNGAAYRRIALAVKQNHGPMRTNLQFGKNVAPRLRETQSRNSGNPNEDYWAEGITDELISQLTKIANLRVISRTSADRFRTSRNSLAEISRELGEGQLPCRIA